MILNMVKIEKLPGYLLGQCELIVHNFLFAFGSMVAFIGPMHGWFSGGTYHVIPP